ncbi:MAG: M20/M25/M40 family metallo-hydrolase [Candidatus Wallbacteria bacterium]|nr:M20/M25/M40 family metallo-hydrolase [Candidatus Wallbacteria bacterium]
MCASFGLTAGKDGPAGPELEARLHRHVDVLAREIGERNVFRPAALEKSLAGTAQLPWRLRIGAHYDSVSGSPGADDNASGVAALLELSRALAATPPRRDVRFVAFVNEEPPFFTTDAMGSRVYARAARRRGDRIDAMLSLECLGYYDDRPGSQRYPPGLSLFYPGTANYIAVVGSWRQRSLASRFHTLLARQTALRVECAAVPESLPGVSWSDHASFWEQGYPALMVTDTAPYRNPNYHDATDRPATLDYGRLRRVTAGLASAIRTLANE